MVEHVTAADREGKQKELEEQGAQLGASAAALSRVRPFKEVMIEQNLREQTV